MIARAVAVAAVAAALAVPATAGAAKIGFGSDLKSPANLTEAFPGDAVFWAKAFPDGRGVAAPAKGQIVTLKVKGTAIKHGNKNPVTLFHFQVLHPVKDAQLRVSLTSGNFHVPVGGDPNHVSTYHPVNLCAKKGDFIGFSGVGGFEPKHYPSGTPFRIFSSIAGSTTSLFTKSGGINNDYTFKPKPPHPGEEVLMRMVLGTGKDSVEHCR